jgi:hypothetical protein
MKTSINTPPCETRWGEPIDRKDYEATPTYCERNGQQQTQYREFRKLLFIVQVRVNPLDSHWNPAERQHEDDDQEGI